MDRIVEPEILDALPPSEPRAVRSRADLQRVNRLMRHVPLLARLWRKLNIPAGKCSLAELGAGDGTLCLKLARRLHRQWILQVTLVDRHEVVSQATLEDFHELGCETDIVTRDVVDWLQVTPRKTVLMANLFLHHFPEPELKRLLQFVSERTDYFIACEPRRDAWGLLGSRMLGWIGCNDVTRHDAQVSVRAGFAGREISALWPGSGWHLVEEKMGMFTHGFAARRTGPGHASSPF